VCCQKNTRIVVQLLLLLLFIRLAKYSVPTNSYIQVEIKEELSYNPKLGLDCKLSKDLKKNRRDDQLVKHKDIRLYLLIYIPSNHKE